MVKKTIVAQRMVPAKTITTVTRVARKNNNKRRRARMAGVPPCVTNYAKCVLDPSSHPSKIPDAACHSVLLEMDLAITGKPINGYLAAMAYPGLPCSAFGLIGTFSGPGRTGVNTTASVSVQPGGIMYPFQDFTQYVSGAFTTGSLIYNIQDIKSARFVSYKLEVVPTGALLQQGGSAATAKVPVFWRFGENMHDNGTTFCGATYAGATNHSWWLGDMQAASFSNISGYPEAKICSGTESCVMMGMPNDTEFHPVAPLNRYSNSVVDCYPCTDAIVTTGTGTGAWFGPASTATFAMIPAESTDISLFGNFWMMEEGEALVWTGQGLPDDQAYAFRIRACVELCVSPSSSYRAFVSPPEPAYPTAVADTRNVLRALPPSLPKPDSSPGWWATVTNAATAVGETISGLGIPVLSPIAGLAAKIGRKLLM